VGITIFVGGTDQTSWIYNNVIWNSHPIPLQLDARGDQRGQRCYIWNNTVDSSLAGSAFRVVGTGLTYLECKNNHFIGGGINTDGIIKLVTSNNLSETLAQANSAGYSLDNQYRPSRPSSPTLRRGINLSANFTTDLLGNARPVAGPWDIGAYHFGSSPKPQLPRNPRVVPNH
jgi:hypothetical protein